MQLYLESDLFCPFVSHPVPVLALSRRLAISAGTRPRCWYCRCSRRPCPGFAVSLVPCLRRTVGLVLANDLSSSQRLVYAGS